MAITDMTYYMFDADETVYKPYLIKWANYNELAKMKEDEEYNVRINEKWKHANKHDPKKLWKLIDWKDKKQHCPKDDKPSATIIDEYFRSIFQSSKICMNPTTDDVIQKVEDHKLYIPLLDDDININEFNIALQEMGNGIGPDAIHPSIVR